MARIRSVLALALVVVCATSTSGQQKFEMKGAYFVGDQHAMSQWLVRWSERLEKESGGRIVVKRFPGSQMGPVQQHYDFAAPARPTWPGSSTARRPGGFR